MSPARLRALIRKYGNLGVLLAGFYLWRRSLSLRGRIFICLLGLTFITIGFLLLTHLSSPRPADSTMSKNLHGPQLLERARKVTEASRWEKSYGYYWLSNQEVLYFLDQAGLTVGQRNVATGKEQPLCTIVEWYDPSKVIVSPNGKWIYCSSVICSECPPAFDVFWRDIYGLTPSPKEEKNGRESLASAQGCINWLWMADSRHWVELPDSEASSAKACLVVHDIQNPKRTRKVPRSPLLSVDGYARVFTADGRLLIATASETSRGIVEIIATRLGKSLSLLHRYRVPLPENTSADTIAFSPQADQIAWLLRPKDLPNVNGYPAWCSLWISGLDGTGMRKIGSQDTHQDTQGRLSSPYSLKWMPDGKRLSFLCNGALYTVPTD